MQLQSIHSCLPAGKIPYFLHDMELEQTFRRQMGRHLERTHRRKSERRYYKIKGGKTVRITVYCDDEEDALALKNILEELSGKSRRRTG